MTETFNADEFQSIKNIVQRKVEQLDELKAQVKELNESLKNIFINDGELSDLEYDLKEFRAKVTKRKKELKSSAEAIRIQNQLMERKDEISDISESLDNQLVRLYQLTGVKEFEMPDGTVREYAIKTRVKARR